MRTKSLFAGRHPSQLRAWPETITANCCACRQASPIESRLWSGPVYFRLSLCGLIRCPLPVADVALCTSSDEETDEPCTPGGSGGFRGGAVPHRRHHRGPGSARVVRRSGERRCAGPACPPPPCRDQRGVRSARAGSRGLRPGGSGVSTCPAAGEEPARTRPPAPGDGQAAVCSSCSRQRSSRATPRSPARPRTGSPRSCTAKGGMSARSKYRKFKRPFPPAACAYPVLGSTPPGSALCSPRHRPTPSLACAPAAGRTAGRLTRCLRAPAAASSGGAEA
jgi:hypothetical protein